mmetsp:Transcript_47294/g.112387  ORF Transcript_47294/g.112387 Transcript_47294/m.112387 type:complete len:202 (+) Transcript_47294:1400-2005(+)
METWVLLRLGIDAVIHRPVHSFPAQVVDAGRTTGDAILWVLAHAILGLTLPIHRMVPGQADALPRHAAGEPAARVAGRDAAGAPGVQVLDVGGLGGALLRFAVVVVGIAADAPPVMALRRAQLHLVAAVPHAGGARLPGALPGDVRLFAGTPEVLELLLLLSFDIRLSSASSLKCVQRTGRVSSTFIISGQLWSQPHARAI